MNIAYQDDTVLKQRLEKIDGKIVMIPPRPAINHNRVSGNIFSEFRTYLKGKTCEAFSDGVDVFLDENNHFIPDVIIVCRKDIIHLDGIYGAPDLVVEVLSPSTARNDKTKKKRAYQQAGVKEYWIVEPVYKTIEVYLNTNTEFKLDRFYEFYTAKEIAENAKLADDDENKISHIFTEIKVSICDNLIVKLADIFDNVS